MQLAQTDYYENNYWDANDKRVVQENMRRIIPALIIHKRLLITTQIDDPINYNNLCIECTLLKEGDEINKPTIKTILRKRCGVIY